MKEVLLILALLLSVAWLAARVRRGKAEVQEARSPKKLDSTSPFHAVSLKYSSDACDAAKAMTGRRFLSSAAPVLPLPECDALKCHCQFAHHSDRRTGNDRRSPFNPGVAAGGTGTFKIERRQRHDRRQNADLNRS